MSLDDLRPLALLDGLSDDQLRELLAAGDVVPFGPGEELFREGRPADHWWVMLAGSVSLVRRIGPEETSVAVMDSPGQWAGGFRAWDVHGVYLATGRGAAPGRILRVPADRLRDCATAWFPLGVHLLQGMAQTARRIESVARQREALVALGRLAAGFAHEVNNPASAATRAVDALAETGDALQSALRRLSDNSISPEQLRALDALRRGIQPPALARNAMAIADAEDALSDWLAGHGVQRDWLIAPPLAAAGLDVAWCERAAVLLGDGLLEPGLEWIANSLATAALLTEVKESTGRISQLVAAIKSYTQLDRASVLRTDLTEGLQSTLVMLASRIGSGVTVVRNYDPDLPRIEAMPGELNQVWTNLIDNAIDAVDGAGTLRVSARGVSAHGTAHGVVVEIADSGPGIPPDVLPHVFEPFFTTKDVGRGTGLGLDISRRIIVDRHGGDITVSREGDETVFRVTLPTSH
ncbi:MAG TPA: ATP-binding protein [Actinoplanes sp.]